MDGRIITGAACKMRVELAQLARESKTSARSVVRTAEKFDEYIEIKGIE